MKLVAIMIRRLNEDVDYGQFRSAWLPDEIVPGDPRVVLSGINLEDPRDLCTIALIEDADPADIPVWMERIAPIEARRHERIKDLVSDPSVNALYQVVAQDALGESITE